MDKRILLIIFVYTPLHFCSVKLLSAFYITIGPCTYLDLFVRAPTSSEIIFFNHPTGLSSTSLGRVSSASSPGSSFILAGVNGGRPGNLDVPSHEFVLFKLYFVLKSAFHSSVCSGCCGRGIFEYDDGNAQRLEEKC